jgi:hypothetical protein
MWYYAIGNERKGPVSPAEIEALIAGGAIMSETLVWREGMSTWLPLRATELASVPGAIPSPAPYVEGRTTSSGMGRDWPGPEMTCGVDGTDKMFVRFWLMMIPVLIGYGVFFVGIFTESLVLGAAGGFVALTAGVFMIVCSCKFNYRCWMLVSDGKARTTPGQAVGFMFIPLFNLYWQFVAYWGLTLEMNRVIDEYQIPAPRPNPQLMLWYLILGLCGIIPFIGPLASIASLVVGLMAFLQVKATARAMLEWNLAQRRAA